MATKLLQVGTLYGDCPRSEQSPGPPPGLFFALQASSPPAYATLRNVTPVSAAKHRAVRLRQTKQFPLPHLAEAGDPGMVPAVNICTHISSGHLNGRGSVPLPRFALRMNSRARGAQQAEARREGATATHCPHCRQALPEVTDERRSCLLCGDPLHGHNAMLHLKRLFCSDACRQKAYRLRKQEQSMKRSRRKAA